MTDLNSNVKQAMQDMVNGYIKDYVIDNIKLVYYDDEEDPYDFSVEVRKKVMDRWDRMEEYYSTRYIKDSFDYDRMVEDICEAVQRLHEAPKKKSFDDGSEWIDAILDSAEWDSKFNQMVRDGLLAKNRKWGRTDYD